MVKSLEKYQRIIDEFYGPVDNHRLKCLHGDWNWYGDGDNRFLTRDVGHGFVEFIENSGDTGRTEYMILGHPHLRSIHWPTRKQVVDYLKPVNSKKLLREYLIARVLSFWTTDYATISRRYRWFNSDLDKRHWFLKNIGSRIPFLYVRNIRHVGKILKWVYGKQYMIQILRDGGLYGHTKYTVDAYCFKSGNTTLEFVITPWKTIAYSRELARPNEKPSREIEVFTDCLSYYRLICEVIKLKRKNS